MRVLITGVGGFIGTHIVDACLNQQWEVIGVDIVQCNIHHPDFTFLRRDVRELTTAELRAVDYIVHLAFVTNIPNSIQHPVDTTRDNIEMTVRLLDTATKAGVKKLAFPSTASLFGNNPVPWREDMPADPIEPYSWQKLSCEQLLRMWTVRYGLPTVTLRLFQVFGENQRPDTAMASVFSGAASGADDHAHRNHRAIVFPDRAPRFCLREGSGRSVRAFTAIRQDRPRRNYQRRHRQSYNDGRNCARDRR